MRNLAHPLFSAPAEAIDADMVRGFLSLALEESFTIDYKRNIEAAADTVAAMANTHGGVVLIGVDAHPKDKNLPGDLVGVKPMDKDRLVSKMATTLDPPWWTPDVIPVTVDSKLLLVVRVDPDGAPRPLLHQGAVRVRLDGRNEIADRRLVQMLFQQAAEAPVLNYASDPRFAPDNGGIENRHAYRDAPPDLIIRAAASRPLRPGAIRPRLHGTTVAALIAALSRSTIHGRQEISQRMASLAQGVDPHEVPVGWAIDPERGHAGFVRLEAGHQLRRDLRFKDPALRMECTASIAGAGNSLDVFFDLLFWSKAQLVAGELWIQACYEAVHSLVHDALPALTEGLLGTAALPSPPIELHIAPGRQHAPLNALNLDSLGQRTGNGDVRRGSDFLREDLIAAGDLKGAVTEALRNIALDWRYLHPTLPTLANTVPD
ncbi:helix-turn-helix domain-containing protein [Streptomyces microflavus]|uniref:helix-turn-helix domain-containing protein n=1 Tax=Streptomyces microflavus TaxID=1919 RepID=UPI0037882EBF